MAYLLLKTVNCAVIFDNQTERWKSLWMYLQYFIFSVINLAMFQSNNFKMYNFNIEIAAFGATKWK